jgi:hypothetical protein
VWGDLRKSATHGLTEPADLQVDDLQHYVYTMRDRGVRPVTCNSRTSRDRVSIRRLHTPTSSPLPAPGCL